VQSLAQDRNADVADGWSRFSRHAGRAGYAKHTKWAAKPTTKGGKFGVVAFSGWADQPGETLFAPWGAGFVAAAGSAPPVVGLALFTLEDAVLGVLDGGNQLG
jgi:hypothetical protein